MMLPRVYWAPVLLAGLLLVGCEQSQTVGGDTARLRTSYHLYGFEKEFGYSQAVRVDKTLYVSGTVAVDPEGKLVGPGDMALQLEAVYANLERTLAAHGATFENVVRERIVTTDMEELLRVSEMRFKYYDANALPTATWSQVERLIDPGFMIEIEVTAELP